MFTKATIVSTLAAFTATMPTVRGSNPNTFTAVSTHSGDQNVHLRTINASGSGFYLNKPTTAFCPQGIANLDCSKYGNFTSFSLNPSGTLYMDVAVPGRQQVYVAAGGAVGYTSPHSAYIPNDAQKATFANTHQYSGNGIGTLTFDNQGFVACPTGEGHPPVYQVYAWIPKVNGTLRTDCTGIGFTTAQYTGAGAAAWEYD